MQCKATAAVVAFDVLMLINEDYLFCFRYVQHSIRLFQHAQVSTFLITAARELRLLAGMTWYVSSSNFFIKITWGLMVTKVVMA